MSIFFILGTNLGFYFQFEPDFTVFPVECGRLLKLRLSTMDKERIEELRKSANEKKKNRIDLTVDELAALKDVSKRSIERLYKDFDDPDKLKATYNKSSVRFTWDNIEEFNRTHSQNFWLSLADLTDGDPAELDPAAGT